MFRTKILEKIKIHTLCPIFFFFEYRGPYEIMWENIVEPERPYDNMAHAHCILDTSGNKHTHRICNTWCFSPKQWLHERVSELLCTYIACLVFLIRNVLYTFRFEMKLLITRRCRGSGYCRWSLTTGGPCSVPCQPA